MATIKQVANKIGKDLNESYPNIQNLFDVLKRGFKDMENVSGGGGGGSEVDWTQLQASGTKIAEIEIDGNKTNVYAPASQTIAVSQIQTTGTKIASISLDGVSTDLYAPNGGGGGGHTLLDTITGDGTITYAQAFSSWLTHISNIKADSYIEYYQPSQSRSRFYQCVRVDSSVAQFICSYVASQKLFAIQATISSAGIYDYMDGTQYTDISSNVIPVGEVLKLYS